MSNIFSSLGSLLGSIGNVAGVPYIGAIAPKAGGFLDSIFGGSDASYHQSKKLMRLQQELQDESYFARLNDERAYTTPKASLGRLMDAGLNPNLLYGEGSAWSGAASVGNPAISHAQRFDKSIADNQRMQLVLQAAKEKAELDYMQSETDKNRAEASSIRDNNRRQDDLHAENKRLIGTQADFNKQNIDYLNRKIFEEEQRGAAERNYWQKILDQKEEELGIQRDYNDRYFAQLDKELAEKIRKNTADIKIGMISAGSSVIQANAAQTTALALANYYKELTEEKELQNVLLSHNVNFKLEPTGIYLDIPGRGKVNLTYEQLMIRFTALQPEQQFEINKIILEKGYNELKRHGAGLGKVLEDTLLGGDASIFNYLSAFIGTTFGVKK